MNINGMKTNGVMEAGMMEPSTMKANALVTPLSPPLVENGIRPCCAVKEEDDSIPNFKANGMEVLIRHIIIEMNDCMFEQLNNPTYLEESLIQMTHIMNTDVKSKATYKFKPHGVTSMLIIGASHISVHTWPEHGYADIDLVVCTKDFEMEDIVAYLNERFSTDNVRFMEIQRGVFA